MAEFSIGRQEQERKNILVKRSSGAIIGMEFGGKLVIWCLNDENSTKCAI